MRLAALLFLLLTSLAARASVPTTNGPVDVLIIVGAAGEKEFGVEFAEASQDWVNACAAAAKSHRLITGDSAGTNQLAEVTDALSVQKGVARDLWVILIGHGTFDGKEAKFNLAGPDFSARELSGLLDQIDRPVILVNSTSSSAPFMNELASPARIIVTATKSGWEENYARFGKFFAKSIVDPTADLDQDGQVSLLEAFLMASRQVDDFYKTEKRLATEHALLDDNGDGKGTPASFFSGVRPAKQPEEDAKVDGSRAHQVHLLPSEAEARLSPELRERLNQLELELEALRAKKANLPEAEYMDRLETIALALSRLYRESASGERPPLD
jgi:hypothetical protein